MKNQSSKIWVRNTCRFFPLTGSRRIRETSSALLTSSIARTGESKPSGRQGGGSKSCVRDIHTMTDVDATTARTTHHKPHFIEVSPRLSCFVRTPTDRACVCQSERLQVFQQLLAFVFAELGTQDPLEGVIPLHPVDLQRVGGRLPRLLPGFGRGELVEVGVIEGEHGDPALAFRWGLVRVGVRDPLGSLQFFERQVAELVPGVAVAR